MTIMGNIVSGWKKNTGGGGNAGVTNILGGGGFGGGMAGATGGGGSPFGKVMDGIGGFFNPGQKTKNFWNDYKGIASDRRKDEKGVLDTMSQNDDTYAGEQANNVQNYRVGRDAQIQEFYDNNKRITDQAQDAETNARKTYTDNIQPAYKNSMENAQREAYGTNGVGGAMTLAEAGDPNNATATKVRKFYEDQAGNESKAGMADVGVMQSLGAQAAGEQMGSAGVPMTGGQMAAIYGQNQTQASQAAANVQRRVQNLRDQGLERGFDESAKQYERGERARDRAQNYTKDFQDAEGREFERGRQSRADIYGLNNDATNMGLEREKDDFGLSSGMSGLRHGLGERKGNRELASIGSKYDTLSAGKQAQLKADTAAQAGQMGMFGQLGGTLLGGLLGGGGGMFGGGGGGGLGSGSKSGYDDTLTQSERDKATGAKDNGNATQQDIDSIEAEMGGSDDGTLSYDEMVNSANNGGFDGGGQQSDPYAGSSPGSQGANGGFDSAPAEDDPVVDDSLFLTDDGSYDTYRRGYNPYARRRQSYYGNVG